MDPWSRFGFASRAVRGQAISASGRLLLWAAEPRPYLEGVAEFDWSRDGSPTHLSHTWSGDPRSYRTAARDRTDWPIFTAPAGLHCHFPVCAPDSSLHLFRSGFPAGQAGLSRVRSAGGTPERITSHMGRVSYPVLLDRRTLLYLATDPDGPGPWLYSMDV